MNNEKCPCGSNKTFEACCESIVNGTEKAKTAEALMRSRYSAYVKKVFSHVYNSYHPETKKHFALDAIEQQAEHINWVGLTINEVEMGQELDAEGYVSFSAQYQMNGQSHYLNEKSHFARIDGEWLYVNGETKFSSKASAEKVGRNAPCPCESGKKYKKCCGAMV